MKFSKSVDPVAPPPAPAAQTAASSPQPGVLLHPGRHVINGAAVDVPGEKGIMVYWPLPAWGRYIIDDKITYAHNPRAGITIASAPGRES